MEGDQLALRFPRDARFRSAELLPNPAQEEAQAWLARTADWPLRRLFLWGATGCGKTHLLHAWAERLGGAVLGCEADDEWPEAPVALDEADQVRDEEALLHLLNRAAEAGQPVLMAGRVPPGRMQVALPDLASRLRATTAVEIGAAPDGFLQMLLSRLLAERQLRVSEPVQAWLLTRLSRSPGALRDAVALLDAKALERGQGITRALASSVLGLDESPAGVSPDAGGVE